MGGIIGALIGRHLAHQEDQREMAFNPIRTTMEAYEKDPIAGPVTPEEYMAAVKAGVKMKRISKDIMPLIESGTEYVKRQRELRDMNAKASAMMDAAPKMSGTPPFQGDLGSFKPPAPGPQGGPPGPNLSSMQPSQAQDLQAAQSPFAGATAPMGGFMEMTQPTAPPQAAKPQPPQMGSASPPMQQPGFTPTGVPQPPFGAGAGSAGPAPQGPPPAVKEMVNAGIKGGQGFTGGMPPPAPSRNYQNPLPIPRAIPSLGEEPERPFFMPSRTPQQVGALAGEQAGAKAAGVSRAQFDINWEEAEKKIAYLKANGLDKLPPYQQQQMIARAIGIEGAFAPAPKPMNLPASEIWTDELPEDATDVEGRPIDRKGAPTAWRQQQGVGLDGNPRIVYYKITPRLSAPRQVTTDKGTFLVSVDKRGNLAKVIDAINGSPILNPALLESVSTVVRNTLIPVTQADGSVQLVPAQLSSSTAQQKQVPGQAPGQASAAPAVPGMPLSPDGPPASSGGAAAQSATGLRNLGDVWQEASALNPIYAPAPSLVPGAYPDPGRKYPVMGDFPGAPTAPEAQAPRPPARLRPTGPQPREARVTGPGVSVGDRPMTPHDKVIKEQQAEQMNTAIGRIKRLQKNVGVLASAISAGKIAMQIDPEQGIWKGFLNKNMPMSPLEKQVAQDWQYMTEAVMMMRLPLGAAANRGKEGFHAVQSSKGILTQHPEIIKGSLDRVLDEFRAQRDPIANMAKKYGMNIKPEQSGEDEEQPGMPSPPAKAGMTPPPLPARLTAADVGKVYNKGGKNLKILEVDPNNNKRFRFEEQQ